MKKILFASLLFSLLTLNAWAQDAKAELKSESTFVKGLEISLLDAKGVVVQHINTNEEGEFELKNVKPGNYIVAVGKHIGNVKYENLKVKHTVTAPRDAASGLATGRRMHKPFVITKEWGNAAPRMINVEDKGIQENGIKEAGSKKVKADNGKVSAGLQQSGSALASGAALVGGALPGGAILSAAFDVTIEAQDIKQANASNTGNNTARINPSRANIRTAHEAAPAELDNLSFAFALDVQEKEVSLIGNVLKTKHDTVKNSINNVR